MAKYENKQEIKGKVGRDPEMRYTPGGKAVTEISVYSRRKRGQDDWYSQWFRVSFWEDQAEWVNENIRKGDYLYIEGTLECDPKTGGPRIWIGKDGNPGASFEVTGRFIAFIPESERDYVSDGATTEPDEIPF